MASDRDVEIVRRVIELCAQEVDKHVGANAATSYQVVAALRNAAKDIRSLKEVAGVPDVLKDLGTAGGG